MSKPWHHRPGGPLGLPGCLIVAASLALAVMPADAAGQELGSVRGRVVDAETGAPLASVSVTLRGDTVGGLTITRADGVDIIPGVAAGSYVVSFQTLGYSPATRTDVIVSPGRSVTVNAELDVAAIEIGEIVVNAGYFPQQDVMPASVVGLNAEEVRRAPGSAGDVSRVLFSLPSTGQVADNANDLYVRGGSPFENGFFIDHVQVPNINHFPALGSTGGPIGMVNVEFIDDVRFSAGGFSAAYGDRLSSVVDIEFRDGNREELETRLKMTMAGFGGAIEGPVGENGSWFLSGRKSFLDLIVDAIGTGVAPRYGDIHAKAMYEPRPGDRISVLGLFGSSRIEYTEADSRDLGNPLWGEAGGGQGTVGLTWRHVWPTGGYTVNALSVTAQTGTDMWWRVASGDTMVDSDYLDGALRFRNYNRWRLNRRSSIELGAELEAARADFDYTFGSYFDRLGVFVPSVSVDRRFDGVRASAFLSHVWTPVPRLSVTPGVRGDHYTSSGNTGRARVHPRGCGPDRRAVRPAARVPGR